MSGFEGLVSQILSSLQPGASVLSTGYFTSPSPLNSAVVQIIFLEDELGRKYDICGISDCGNPEYICS